MTAAARAEVAVVRRAAYRLERARGRRWRREPSVELDLAAVVVLSGHCRAAVGETSLELDAPALLLVNPGSSLGIRGSGSPYEHVALGMRPGAVDRAAATLGLDGRAVLLFGEPTAEPDAAVSATARRIAAEFERALPGREEAFDLLAALLAVDVLRAHARADRSPHVERSRVGLVDRRLRRAAEFMHDNFERDLAAGEIAAAAYLSEFHFARLFKRVTGLTPHAYLAGVRMAAAERLLAETDLPVAEVGARAGYQSASHFAKVFRAATGLTPTAFRDALVR